jgi:pimeloyl-ACP methyl ester carboxylesterase
LHLVDLRNHGASPWSDDTSYAAMARDVAALIERLGPGPVRVVGHGMRGFLLQNLDTVDGRFTWRPNLAALLAAMPALTGFPAELAGRVFRGPAWCLRGGESSYVEAEGEAALRRHFPRLGLRSVPGAGHWPHAERPVRSSPCSSPRSPPDAFGRACSAEQ